MVLNSIHTYTHTRRRGTYLESYLYDFHSTNLCGVRDNIAIKYLSPWKQNNKKKRENNKNEKVSQPKTKSASQHYVYVIGRTKQISFCFIF